MSNNIVKSKTFDASLISYDEPKTNSKGGKALRCSIMDVPSKRKLLLCRPGV